MDHNRATIEAFYSAFARLDTDAMAACYADNAHFQDEVFTLSGKREVMGMWRMLVGAVQAKGRDDWRLTWRDTRANGSGGAAHWDAHYRFSATGRLVDNSIDSRVMFDATGRILRHRDTFDFWRWSKQALGAPGLLLGWTPMLRRGVQRKADANLRHFLAKESP